MNFIPKKIAKNILLAACLIGSGASYASTLNFTSKSGNLGHSFTETNDGVTIKVSGFKFSGGNSTPSSAGAQNTIIEGFGGWGLGIGGVATTLSILLITEVIANSFLLSLINRLV